MEYWVNLSKRGRKDRDFQAGRATQRDFPWAKPGGNPKAQPCQPRKTPSFPTLLLIFTFYFQHCFSKYWGQQASIFFLTLFQLSSDDKLQILLQLSFHKYCVQNIFVFKYFVARFLWKFVKKKALTDCLGASFIVQNIFVINYFVVGPLWKFVKKKKKKKNQKKKQAHHLTKKKKIFKKN